MNPGSALLCNASFNTSIAGIQLPLIQRSFKSRVQNLTKKTLSFLFGDTTIACEWSYRPSAPAKEEYMKRVITSCLAVMGMAAMLQADVWNKKTILTVNQTIEVPGATLTPGKYVVKLMDSQSNRHIVQFMNEREDEVLSTVLAIPNQRLKPTGETEFSFYEAGAGEARALQAWFYPGDTIGHEFAYPKEKAMALARTSGHDVPSFAGDDPTSAEVTTVSPSETRAEAPAERPPAPTRTEPEAVVRDDRPEPTPEPRVMAQAQQPAPQDRATPREDPVRPSPLSNQQRAAGQFEPSELPATSSPAPLLGLIGLLSLGGAIGLRRLMAKR
jgi:hypothetical protein